MRDKLSYFSRNMYKKLGKKCHNEVIEWTKDMLFENVWLKKSRLEIALLFLVRMKMSSTVSMTIIIIMTIFLTKVLDWCINYHVILRKENFCPQNITPLQSYYFLAQNHVIIDAPVENFSEENCHNENLRTTI